MSTKENHTTIEYEMPVILGYDENGGAVEETPETDVDGYEQEEEIESQPEQKEEKKKRGFFGLFNRNS